MKTHDDWIREEVAKARTLQQETYNPLVHELFDTTPITDESLTREGFVLQPKLMMEKGEHRIIPWIEEDNSACFVLFSGTSDKHGIKVRNMGELRRVMTIGKDW